MKFKLPLFALALTLASCVAINRAKIEPTDKKIYAARYMEFRMDEQYIDIYLKNSKQFTRTGFTAAALTLPLDQSFIRIAKDDPKIKQKYGSFKFVEKPKKRCNDLIIKDIDFTATVITLTGALCDTGVKMTLTSDRPNTVKVDISLDDKTYNRITLVQSSTENEAIFGMGEQFSHVNLRGERVPVWVEEQGIGRGDQPLTALANRQMAGGDAFTTYAPMPFYISSYKKSVELHGKGRSVFDFRYTNSVEIEAWGNTLSATITQMNNPLDLIEKYTEKRGRLPTLPDWAYGAILGVQGGAKRVENKLDTLLEVGAPISAIWVQDWCGKRETPLGNQLRWHWTADESRYPNIRQFCEKMSDENIAVLGYINPFLTNDGELYETALREGYFVKNDIGEAYIIETPGFEACLIDLTNPRAFSWLKNVVKNRLIGNGFSGWMADYGEWLPYDAVLHDGRAGFDYQNQYPVDWARLNREAIQEADREGEIAFFSRSAFTGSNAFSTFYWAGDQATNWKKNDGLPSVVPALLSSGMSGMSINHADIGGFSSFQRMGISVERDPELLQRWIELCAFTPIFRSHESIRPNENIQVYDTPEMRDFYTRFAQIHEALRPYLQEQMEAATEKGYPIVRHLYLHYPTDKNTYKLRDQFLLGEDVLVAPVVKKGALRVEVYLPEGEWTHAFTGKKFEGAYTYQVDARLGTPAVFIKTNSDWLEILGLGDL